MYKEFNHGKLKCKHICTVIHAVSNSFIQGCKIYAHFFFQVKYTFNFVQYYKYEYCEANI